VPSWGDCRELLCIDGAESCYSAVCTVVRGLNCLEREEGHVTRAEGA